MVRHRPELDSIPSYKQGKSSPAADAVKLSSNENPYPPLDSVRDGLIEALGSIQLYPRISAPEITARIAERYGVTADNVALGSGSVEVATQLVLSMAGEGDEVLFAWRSFEAYPIITITAGATPVMVPLTSDERHDLDAMAEAITERTRLIFICNPNNPTGGIVTRDELDAFMAKVPSDVLVVVDEAYEHFNVAEDSVIGADFFERYDNVAVLHTFSKAYGLAGLRIGYAIAKPDVVACLRKVAVPFAVSELAQRAAILSLDAEAELQERVDIVVAERARVETALREQGWRIHPSQANFVWLRTGDATDEIEARFAEAGLIVRAFGGEGMRVTIGTPEANDRFIAAAEQVVGLVS